MARFVDFAVYRHDDFFSQAACIFSCWPGRAFHQHKKRRDPGTKTTGCPGAEGNVWSFSDS